MVTRYATSLRLSLGILVLSTLANPRIITAQPVALRTLELPG